MLPVEAHRRSHTARHPVHHDVGEQLVQSEDLGEAAIGEEVVVRVRPHGELLQYVGGQTHGRVIQAICCRQFGMREA